MTEKQTSNSLRRLIAVAVLASLSGALAGCGSFNVPSIDPTDLFDFLDTKKKLPGDRRAVFPEGVPGLEQGVPKDLYKGARASAPAEVAPVPPPVIEQPQQKRRTAARPKREPVQQEPVQSDGDAAAADEGVAAAPPAPPPPRRRTTQRQQPVQQQQPADQDAAPAPFPAPLPSGSFSR